MRTPPPVHECTMLLGSALLENCCMGDQELSHTQSLLALALVIRRDWAATVCAIQKPSAFKLARLSRNSLFELSPWLAALVTVWQTSMTELLPSGPDM